MGKINKSKENRKTNVILYEDDEPTFQKMVRAEHKRSKENA